jgi:hypothetical protein
MHALCFASQQQTNKQKNLFFIIILYTLRSRYVRTYTYFFFRFFCVSSRVRRDLERDLERERFRERERERERFGSIDIGETFWLFGSR